MGKIPHFAGRSSLSLTDLQALADAVPLPVAQVQPAAATRGRVQYGLAQYNVQADECAGEVAVPDAEGMIAGVVMDAVGEPYIDEGVMHLPAGAGGGGCNCVPASYDECVGGCLGLISSVGYYSDLRAADICYGSIRLPRACSDGGCNGVVGGVAGVLFDDAAAGPFIDDGVIVLPTGLQGVMTVDGPMSWSDLRCAGVVRLHDGDATTLGVSAEVVGGYLNIYVDRQ